MLKTREIFRKYTLSKFKKRKFLVFYVVYLLIVSTSGFFIYSYFTDSDISGLTIDDLFNPDYENREGHILQKTNDSDLPYVLNQGTTRVFEGITYTTNSDGFRDKEYTVEKNGSRIIFIGDSFTYGWLLPIEDTFVKILEKQLQQTYPDDDWEVMNLGVFAYPTELEVEYLEEKGLKYNPDIVIIMYYLNDPDIQVDNISFAVCGSGIALKIIDYFNGRLSGQEKNQVEEFMIQQNCYDKLKNLEEEIGCDNSMCLMHYIPLLWNSVKDSFDKLENLSIEHNFTVIVGIIPSVEWEWDNYPYTEIHKLVSNEIKRHNFYLLDLYPALSKYPPNKLLVYPDETHTSYFANQIIAITIEDYLEELNLT